MKIKKLPYLFLLILILVLTCFCSSNPEQLSKKTYKGIERTLNLLNSSTSEHPNTIEILFYGQSIIGGMKTTILVDSLKKRFPSAIINFKHKPIGGFTIPDLTKTTPHDVYQENPDLIIFHAYGGIKDGLYDALIRNIRKRTPSDILLLDHHYVWYKPQTKLESVNKSHDFDSDAIKNIAEKYDCGFVNVREQWKVYLDKNNILPNELMGNTIDSNVHPNAKGNLLLREIVLSKFPKTDNLEYDIRRDSLRELVSLNNSNKQFLTQFSGSIVELVLDSKSKTIDTALEVFVDGKKPSEYSSSFHIERPSEGFLSWMPGISHVSFGKTFPREEHWIIKVYDIDRVNKKFKFSLEGNLTGFDGEGNNQDVFTSNSNRITIDAKDFNIFRTERILKNETPENFHIKFSVNQIAKDTINIISNKNKYLLFKSAYLLNSIKELKINVIKGDSNFEHLIISRPYISDKY